MRRWTVAELPNRVEAFIRLLFDRWAGRPGGRPSRPLGRAELSPSAGPRRFCFAPNAVVGWSASTLLLFVRSGHRRRLRADVCIHGERDSRPSVSNVDRVIACAIAIASVDGRRRLLRLGAERYCKRRFRSLSRPDLLAPPWIRQRQRRAGPGCDRGAPGSRPRRRGSPPSRGSSDRRGLRAAGTP